MAPSLFSVLILIALVFALRIVIEEVVPWISFSVVALGQLDNVVQSLLDILLLVVRPFVLLFLKLFCWVRLGSALKLYFITKYLDGCCENLMP